jgi:hypothetical protein
MHQRLAFAYVHVDTVILLSVFAIQVIYIAHDKATKMLPDILEQNSIPAAHSKGLLDMPHPGNRQQEQQQDSSMQVDGGSSDSEASSDEDAAVVAASKL